MDSSIQSVPWSVWIPKNGEVSEGKFIAIKQVLIIGLMAGFPKWTIHYGCYCMKYIYFVYIYIYIYVYIKVVCWYQETEYPTQWALYLCLGYSWIKCCFCRVVSLGDVSHQFTWNYGGHGSVWNEDMLAPAHFKRRKQLRWFMQDNRTLLWLCIHPFKWIWLSPLVQTWQKRDVEIHIHTRSLT